MSYKDKKNHGDFPISCIALDNVSYQYSLYLSEKANLTDQKQNIIWMRQIFKLWRVISPQVKQIKMLCKMHLKALPFVCMGYEFQQISTRIGKAMAVSGQKGFVGEQVQSYCYGVVSFICVLLNVIVGHWLYTHRSTWSGLSCIAVSC